MQKQSAKKCDVQLIDDKEMVFRMSSMRYAIYTPVAYTASAQCLHEKYIQYQIGKNTCIEIPPGCTLKLKHFTINVPTSFVLPTDPWTFATTWDTLETPKDILRQQYKKGFDLERALLNESAAHHLFKELVHDANNKSAALHDLIQEQLHSMEFEMKMGLFGTAGIGIVAICVAFLYLFVYLGKDIPMKNTFNMN